MCLTQLIILAIVEQKRSVGSGSGISKTLWIDHHRYLICLAELDSRRKSPVTLVLIFRVGVSELFSGYVQVCEKEVMEVTLKPYGNLLMVNYHLRNSLGLLAPSVTRLSRFSCESPALRARD